MKELEYGAPCPTCRIGELIVDDCRCTADNAPCWACTSGVLTCSHCHEQFSPEEKETTMSTPTNQDILNMLHLQNGVQTVQVRSSLSNSAPNTSRTYKVPATLFDEVDEGDLVLVTGKDGQVHVGTVTEKDEIPLIQFGIDPPIVYRWVFQRVDRDRAEQILHREERLSKAFALAEAKRRVADAIGELPPEVKQVLELDDKEQTND